MNLGVQLAQSDIRGAVRDGLRLWNRPLWSGDMPREFLGALVSEGELPLAFLKDDDAPSRFTGEEKGLDINSIHGDCRTRD
jgi:hypothetical protein